jgi:chromosome segregation ATPase
MSINNENDSKNSEISELQQRLTEIIESDNKKKLQIKDLEIKNSELSKKNFEFQSHLQNLIIKMNLISQENSSLKLEIKKLQLSVNSPGKIIASLGTTNKTNITLDNLLKEKSELKETNEKLVLVLSERESELSKQKLDYESKINELNDIITEQKAKLSDINNDMKDIQEQLNLKDKEIKSVKEQKGPGEEYNKLKIEYDILEQKYEQNMGLYNNSEKKCGLYENENKSLNDRVIKIEQAFSSFVKGDDPKVKDISDLQIYTEISENLRLQIIDIQDEREKMEKAYEETNNKNKENLRTLEDKLNSLTKENNELQKQIEDFQNNFITGTMKLNTEISSLNDKILQIEKERDEYKKKYENLLKDLEKNSNNFLNLQNIMTKLREKDDIDITLIEERYLVLENVLELEKNEIVNTNRELINKVKLLTQNGNNNTGGKSKESKDEKDNSLKLEIKNLTDENKLLQLKIKEQEKRLFQLQKKTDILNVIKEENETLKKNNNENNVNLQVIIKELTNKTNQLNEELLQSRKRTSLLRSKPNFEIKLDNKKDVEKYQKEIESLKNEMAEQKKKDDEEIDSLKIELSNLKVQLTTETCSKEEEIMKLKSTNKKYRDLLESNGILKKKQK